MIEHHPSGCSQRGVLTNRNELSGHDLVCSAFEARCICSPFAGLAEEWRDIFEQITIRDHADTFVGVAFNDQVVIDVGFKEITDVLDRIIHINGLDRLSHDVIDDEWFQRESFREPYLFVQADRCDLRAGI